jgi:hypothetical protein
MPFINKLHARSSVSLLCIVCYICLQQSQWTEFLMHTKRTVYRLEDVHGSILRYGICLVVLLGLYQSL